MPLSQRLALALITFGLAGLALIIWQPQGHATSSELGPPTSYFLAISSGAGLQLADSAERLADEPAALSCKQVFQLGAIAIGARCVSHGWTVTVER